MQLVERSQPYLFEVSMRLWGRVLLALVVVLLLAGCSHLEVEPINSLPAESDGPSAPNYEGEALYVVSCASCHQIHGQGMEGVGPPLAGSKWVNGNEVLLTKIVLHGVRGPITVRGKEYNLEMPAMGFFSDQQIAGLLTYLRQEWGNQAPMVAIETVAKVRNTFSSRGDSWTAKELDVN